MVSRSELVVENYPEGGDQGRAAKAILVELLEGDKTKEADDVILLNLIDKALRRNRTFFSEEGEMIRDVSTVTEALFRTIKKIYSKS